MKRKIIIICLLSVLLILIVSTQVNAEDITPTYPHRFSRGVSNTCYYIDSSVSQFTNRINGAARNWEVTGFGYNPIHMTAVSSNKGTHMDFYGKHEDWFGAGQVIYGETVRYNSWEGRVSGEVEDWFFTQIRLNVDDIPLCTVADQQGIAAHEMGHAFGLKHNSSPYSIMFLGVKDWLTSVVAKCDHDAINLLYNN